MHVLPFERHASKLSNEGSTTLEIQESCEATWCTRNVMREHYWGWAGVVPCDKVNNLR